MLAKVQAASEEKIKTEVMRLGGAEKPLYAGLTGLLGGAYPWTIETKYGQLGIHVSQHTIFCRFAEPERAKGVFGSNPYSGKWNFHFDVLSEANADYFLDCIRRALETP
jgi:hypothetical protein